MTVQVNFSVVVSMARRHLSPLFSVGLKCDIAYRRRKGSRYESEFFHPENRIYFDLAALQHRDPVHVFHSVGEEVGHSIHYLLKPDLFGNSSPTTNTVVESIEKGNYGGLCQRVIEASNLVEFVGFFAGLEFLTRVEERETALRYAAACQEIYRDYTPARFRITESLAKANDAQVQERYKEDPEGLLQSVREGKQDDDVQRVMSYIKHGFGYYLAAEVWKESAKTRRKAFTIALESDRFTQFYGRLRKRNVM